MKGKNDLMLNMKSYKNQIFTKLSIIAFIILFLYFFKYIFTIKQIPFLYSINKF